MSDAKNATEKVESAKKGKGKRKQLTVRQQFAKLRKEVKELAAQVAVLMGDTPVKTVEQASIDNSGNVTGEGSTLRKVTTMSMTDLDRIRSTINAAAVLPSTARDEQSLMHTCENLSAICGFEVTEEMREDAYSDEKFKMHLKEFGLTRTADKPKG